MAFRVSRFSPGPLLRAAAAKRAGGVDHQLVDVGELASPGLHADTRRA